jgi:hypothetical protein
MTMETATSVDRLLAVISAGDMFDTMVKNMIENMGNGLLPAQMVESMKAAFLEVFTIDTFAPVMARHLRENFTDEEMAALADFFATGVGQKWVENAGPIQVAVNDEIKEIVNTKMPEVLAIFERLTAS